VAGRLVADPGRRLALKALLPAGLVLLAVVAWFRPQLFGADYFDYNGRLIRSYDEQNLHRLAWFVTVPGIAATLAGFAVVALRRWRAAVWIAVGPAVVLLVLYLYQAVNSTRLMWWSRRYVPSGLLVFALLIGIACAAAWAWRGRGRWLARAAAVAVAGLVVGTGLVQSLPLARHREFGRTAPAPTWSASSAPSPASRCSWSPVRWACRRPSARPGCARWTASGWRCRSGRSPTPSGPPATSASAPGSRSGRSTARNPGRRGQPAAARVSMSIGRCPSLARRAVGAALPQTGPPSPASASTSHTRPERVRALASRTAAAAPGWPRWWVTTSSGRPG
jgi:hypothetical protein